MNGIWDVSIGSTYDATDESEKVEQRRTLYMDMFWQCTLLTQMEKVMDCMGTDLPCAFTRALKYGRDYVWVMVSGKRAGPKIGGAKRDISPTEQLLRGSEGEETLLVNTV